jgi:DNA-directed RNA polymerase specialized sigma24 family protein
MVKPPQNAFHRQLFDENCSHIHNLAKLKLVNKNLADAVVQATFIKALEEISALEKDHSPGAWLTNTALELIEWCNTLKELPRKVTHDE